MGNRMQRKEHVWNFLKYFNYLRLRCICEKRPDRKFCIFDRMLKKSFFVDSLKFFIKKNDLGRWKSAKYCSRKNIIFSFFLFLRKNCLFFFQKISLSLSLSLSLTRSLSFKFFCNSIPLEWMKVFYINLTSI